jgi:uracil-DNA glycosylase family 4
MGEGDRKRSAAVEGAVARQQIITPTSLAPEPPRDCPLCPRLVEFRRINRNKYPAYFNNPVPTFGDPNARLLIVGLAPGLHGANQTGRPFTGDYAGDLLYSSLIAQGLARGTYGARSDDGLELVGCAITNAVRCVPPENKPLPLEIGTCRQYLAAQLAAMPNLRAVLTLGRIAHESVLKALNIPARSHPFAHGAQHRAEKLTLVASYHCSRYNTNTGVLTPEMFNAALAAAKTAARE